MKKQIIEAIAQICHEANKAYCESVCNDFTQKSWSEADQWQKDAIIAGVQYQIQNPEVTPEMSHIEWCNKKIADGWVYGEIKDSEKKTHPCLVSYSELPAEERWKDDLRISIIKSMINK